MFRYVFIIFFLVLPIQISAQLFQLSDHYDYDALLINPAFAGRNNALSMAIMYRNQWIGYEDAPKSLTISVHTPLNKDRIGLGLIVNSNNIGIFNETSIIGNYAFRRELTYGKLALGLGFGLNIFNTAWNELQATDPDDEVLTNNSSSAVLPDFSIGVYYYTERFFMGVSLPLFLSHITDENSGDVKIKNDFSNYNYFLSAGCQINTTSATKLMPSILVKYHPDHPIQIDYSAKFIIKNRIGIGLGYRSKAILVGSLHCQINDQFRIIYSYDYSVGSSAVYKKGSHEINLEYVFSYKRRVISPRQF